MTAFAALTSSDSNEWYTPPSLIEMARSVMGSIELDPASNLTAEQWIKADRFFSFHDDGLNQEWKAKTIWMNPPYGTLGGKFCTKLLSEFKAGNIEQAIALVRGDSAGMESLFDYAWHCRSKRIRFIPSDELLAEKLAKNPSWKNSPVPGSTIFYLGDRKADFVEVFHSQGKIFKPSVKVESFGIFDKD